MPLVYDMNKDVRFNQGIAKGIEKGIEKGILLKDQLLVIHLLKKEKFSLDTIADLSAVTLEFVEETQQAYFLALNMLKENHSEGDIASKTGLLLDVIQKIK